MLTQRRLRNAWYALLCGRAPIGGEVHAKDRYGLPRLPSTRVEVALPKGTPVKSGKVIGGEPGVGELKIHHRKLPPPAVKTVIHLRK